MVYYHSLDEIDLSALPEFGGKAARLGAAKRLGCPVLPGVALSTELYRRFMQQGGLEGEIHSILSTMQPTTLTHFQAAEWAIQNAFGVRRVPAEVRETLRQAWETLGHASLAVRSSAIREDSPLHSFVGQHATFLNVANDDDLLDAVIGCWRSLYSAKALAYAHRFGVDLTNSAMAVLLQPMVRTTQAGALFTVDPISGSPEQFVIEVQQGLRPGLSVLSPYERSPGESPLWSQLRRYGLLLDEHLLAYQAIEWVAQDDKLYLMRVRPVTGLTSHLPQHSDDIGAGSEPLTLARPKNLTQRALRPYSWYHRSRSPGLKMALERRANQLFWPYAGRDEYYVCGYLYYRWRRFARPPFDAKVSTPRLLLDSLQRLNAARTLDRTFRGLWENERPALTSMQTRDVSTLDNGALADYLHETMRIEDAFLAERSHLGDVHEALSDILCRLHEYWLHEDPLLCNQMLWSGDDQLTHCHEALCGLAHTDFADQAESDQALQAFVARFGHMFPKDDPLNRWGDICCFEPDQARIQALWQQWTQNPDDDLCARNQAQREHAQDAARRTLQRLGRVKRAIYRRVLALARRYAPLQSDRDEPVLLCRRLEQVVVQEVGQRLSNEGLVSSASDASLLGYREMLDWLRGELPRDVLVREVLERKDLMRRWARYAPPDELKPRERDALLKLDENADQDVFRGRAVSPGRARGPARLITSVQQAATVLPGEVIVCREPHFELTPMFGLASAVVCETGGLLDHSSVLAREYGIPAVFSVQGVTEAAHNGEDLEVDANQGLVVRHHAPIEWEIL